jgi:hypothetical protein
MNHGQKGTLNKNVIIKIRVLIINVGKKTIHYIIYIINYFMPTFLII